MGLIRLCPFVMTKYRLCKPGTTQESAYFGLIRDVTMGNMRKQTRTNVNIQTGFVVQGIADLLIGNMTNISCGGCRVALNQPSRVPVGAIASMTFNLPYQVLVKEIQATVTRVDGIKGSPVTTLGCAFTGPSSETSKVANVFDVCDLSQVW